MGRSARVEQVGLHEKSERAALENRTLSPARRVSEENKGIRLFFKLKQKSTVYSESESE